MPKIVPTNSQYSTSCQCSRRYAETLLRTVLWNRAYSSASRPNACTRPIVATDRWIDVVSSVSTSLASTDLFLRMSAYTFVVQTSSGAIDSASSVSCQFIVSMIHVMNTSVIALTNTVCTPTLSTV